MSKLKSSLLTAHMIVKNEDQWIWYALQSVLPYVEKILVYDTGSTDRTVQIISSIKSKKINLTRKGAVSAEKLVELRNEQIEETSTPWFLILDGDEVWSGTAMTELQQVLAKTQKYAVVLKVLLPVGDLTRFQPESAGRYRLLGRRGHYNIRAYKKVPGYRWKGVYPNEAYVDSRNTPIQNNDNLLHLLKNPYWHMRLLKRSEKRKGKIEWGQTKKRKLPSVFLMDRPDVVPSPHFTMSYAHRIRAIVWTPLLRLKRKLGI